MSIAAVTAGPRTRAERVDPIDLAHRQAVGELPDDRERTAQGSALLLRQLPDRRRRGKGPTVAPLLERLAGVLGEAEPGHSSVAVVPVAHDDLQGHELTHEGRDRVGCQAEQRGCLGHGQARLSSHETHELELGSGEGQAREGGTGQSP